MDEKKQYTAIVLAAGSGSRMHSAKPKQYMDLCGYPLVYYSLRAFEDSPVDDIVLVTGKDDVGFCRTAIVEAYGLKKVRTVVAGGTERYLSVYEGVKAAQGADYVLIHDGARPMLTQQIIARSMEAVAREQACVVGMPVKDTIKVSDGAEYAAGTPDRSRLWAVQTPQSFSRALLLEAYDAMGRADATSVPTDDAMLVEQFTGQKVKLIRGTYENIKVTTPEDLLIAEVFLKKAKK